MGRAGQSKADQQVDTNTTCCSVRWRELVLRRLMKVLDDPVERWLQQHNGLVGSRGEDPAGAEFFSRGKTGFPGLAVALPKTSLLVRAARRGLGRADVLEHLPQRAVDAVAGSQPL